MRSRGLTLSILLTARHSGDSSRARRSRAWASSSVHCSASTTNRQRSASVAAATAVRFMERLMARCSPECKPGVSTKISCSVAVVLMPSTRRRVVCGLGVTMLILRPTKALTSVDLPTLGRPATATKPARKPGSAMVHLLQGMLRRFLLRAASAARLALGADLQRLHAATHPEHLLVRFAAYGLDCIHRQGQVAGLQHFLQARLGILEGFRRRWRCEPRFEEVQDDVARGAEPRIKENRAHQRLERICEDGCAAVTAALEFTGTEGEVGAKVEAAGHFRQGFLVDEVGPQAAQIPLFQPCMTTIQGLGDTSINQGVAQELQTLIVAPAGAAVSERQFQQTFVREPAPQCLQQVGVSSGQWPAV